MRTREKVVKLRAENPRKKAPQKSPAKRVHAGDKQLYALHCSAWDGDLYGWSGVVKVLEGAVDPEPVFQFDDVAFLGTYKVTRMPDETVVAEANETNTFVDEIPSDIKTTYYYIIEPKSGDVTGNPVTSRSILAGKYIALPLDEQFDDEQRFLTYPVIRLNTLNSQKLTAILKAPQTHGLNDLNLRKPTFSPESKPCLKCLIEDYARR